MLMAPEEPVESRIPVWGYEDLAVFLGAVLPSFAIALVAVRLCRRFAAQAFSSEGFAQLVFQSVFYLLLLGVLRIILDWKYQAPFWRSLGCSFQFRNAWLYLALGPVFSIVLGSLTVLLRPPATQSPIEDLIVDRRALVLVLLLGPIFEELVFRGFLYPLLARSVGPWLAIVATAIPFALLHGAQNEWTWQLLAPIGVAGLVFGAVRHKTGSTIASMLVHMGYNSTAVALYLVQKA
jgi:membrane protease YdiL (CAAX protease family)